MNPVLLAFYNACIASTTSLEVALVAGPMQDLAIGNVERCIGVMSELIAEVKANKKAAGETAA